MFLPFGDEPNPPTRAVMNWLLIALNVAVFVFVSLPLMDRVADPRDPAFAEYLAFLARNSGGASLQALAEHVSAYDLFVFEHGFRPSQFSVATLFYSMFLHGGFMHLAGNMLFLWIYGDNIEHRLGRIGYLLVYLLTGAAATLFFAAFAWGSDVPLVGASGAISGVLGCYFFWFPHNRVKVMVLLPFMWDVWRIPSRFVLGFYLIVDNILPFVFSPTGGGGVAHGAHIGGFVGGLGFALLARWLSRGQGRFGAVASRVTAGRPVDEPSFQPVQVARRDGTSATLRRAVALGDFREAAQIYGQLSAEQRANVPDADIMRMSDWLTDSGEYDAALAMLQQFIAAHPADPRGLARAHLRVGLVHLHFKQQPQAAVEHLYQVLELGPTPEMEQVARSALAEAERARRGPSSLN